MFKVIGTQTSYRVDTSETPHHYEYVLRTNSRTRLDNVKATSLGDKMRDLSADGLSEFPLNPVGTDLVGGNNYSVTLFGSASRKPNKISQVVRIGSLGGPNDLYMMIDMEVELTSNQRRSFEAILEKSLEEVLK